MTSTIESHRIVFALAFALIAVAGCRGEDVPLGTADSGAPGTGQGADAFTAPNDGSSDRPDGRDALLPDACAPVVALRKGEVRCSGKAQCDAIKAAPNMRVSFVVEIAELEAPLAQRALHLECIARVLRDNGAIEFAARPENMHVLWIVGTFAQVKPALFMQGVGAIEVGCHTEDVCEQCEMLSQDACTADAFCNPLLASRYDAQNACLAPGTFVGCQSSGSPCSDAISWFNDGDGGCWRRGDGCAPKNWSDGTNCRPAGGAFIEKSCLPCAGRDAESCSGLCAPLTAKRFMDGNSGGAFFAGCMEADRDCGAAETCAVSRDKNHAGSCFWFPSTCIPDSFEVVPCEASCRPAQ